jgi:hypothetical protein
MKHSLKNHVLLCALPSILTAIPAAAANSFYAAGDLVLFFQQAGGTNTVYANLGNAANLYRGTAAGATDGANHVNFLNLSTTLSTAFGASWGSDPSLYAGMAGVYSTNNTNSIIVDGDPARTLYVSAARQSVGTVGEASSSGYSVNTNSGMTSGATGIVQQNNAFAALYDNAVVISPTSESAIDDMNPFSSPGIQGTAMNIFAGGIQQQGSASTFGYFDEAGDTEFALDLYRILGKNGITDQVEGDLRSGSYEGTITIGTNGMVSFLAIPEPSSLAIAGCAAGSLLLRRRRSA